MVECLECNNQCWVELQLVDQQGSGKPYAGLKYLLTDTSGTVHEGVLDADGTAKHQDLPCGGVILSFAEKYNGMDLLYRDLSQRKDYPLPITQLQYVAEHTQWIKKDEFKEIAGWHTNFNDSTIYHQDIEVRHLVEHVGHLPVFGTRWRSKIEFPRTEFTLAYNIRGYISGSKRQNIPQYGIGLEKNHKHVLEIKPLRAYRPVLSLSDEFSSLNLYQLSLLGALSYTDFEEEIIPGDYFRNPVANGYFYPQKTGSGRINSIFISELANHYESGIYGKAIGDPQRFGLLLEDVPYSKRFEIAPYDPEIYPANKLYQEALDNRREIPDEAETPKKIHFFDDKNKKGGMDTQGFITHSDEIVLISIRGTQETQDFFTDAKAVQVQMEQYPDGVRGHIGFYKSFKAIRGFISDYLDRFYSDQKIIVVGHSLGGAIATLAADWIKKIRKIENTILYTFGSPRVGNTEFVKQSTLTHYRMVAENDPIPSVPGEFLSNETQFTIYGGVAGAVLPGPPGQSYLMSFAAYLGVKLTDNHASSTYQHHGELKHFSVLSLHSDPLLSDVIMWNPGCKGAVVCSPALDSPAGLPQRADFIDQLKQMNDHYMFNSYIPFCYSTFLRWKKSVDNNQSVVTKEEAETLEKIWQEYQRKLEDEQWKLAESKKAIIDYQYNRALNQVEHNYSPKNPIIDYNSKIDEAKVNNKNYNTVIEQLKKEIARVELDRARIKTLVSEKITVQQLYGTDVSQNSEINSIYEHWQIKDNEFVKNRPQEVAVIKKI